MQESQLKRLLFALFGFILFGTFSFHLLGHDLWDSFFATTIVLLSHFIHGLDEPVGEQVLTTVLILGSYFILAYIIKGAAEYFFGGQFRENRRKKKMTKAISKMENHYIVCGYGRVGKQIAEELAVEGVDFIVIDRDAKNIKDACSKGFIAIEGDLIKEDSLEEAQIKKAKALIAALGADTDNLFLTLTAKSLNPNLFIVARASENETVPKLEKAGADRISLPYQIGGYHMAGIALRPAVVDFMDVILDGKHSELQIEEINVERGSVLVGRRVADYITRSKTGATVLAINKHSGVSKINPSGEELIERGDQLIVMGTKKQLDNILSEVV